MRLALAAARFDLPRFDVIESANIPYVHLLPLAARAALARRPLVVTWHEYWGVYWKQYRGWPSWPLYGAIEWVTAQLGSRVAAVSDFTATRLERRRMRRGSPVLVANGISVSRVRSAAENVQPGAPLIYAGRLLREKRVDVLLAAVARMEPSRGQKLLTITGTGPDEVRLREITHGLGLDGVVEFTGRLPEPEDAWARMAAARIAVQPSSREGFGMFPLEAMALGLPVVYCRSPESALPELVRDGREGIAVEATPEALAAEIVGLLGDDDRWETLSEAARLRAAEFDWDEIAVGFERLAMGACANRMR
jgi:glycosyltransferase involved in cell wall biosynthesis